MDPKLSRPWLLANFIAFAVGGTIAGGLLRSLEQPYYEVMTSALDAALIQASSLSVSMAVFGAFVGTAQWLVLRRVLRAGWWIPATCVGWGLGGVVMGFNAGGSVSTIGPDAGPIDPLLAGLIGPPLVVFLLGGAQWLILRRAFDGSGWWPFVNVGGLLIGFSVGLVVAKIFPWFTPTDFPSAKALGIVGAVAGLVYGVGTWAFLAELRLRSATEPTG